MNKRAERKETWLDWEEVTGVFRDPNNLDLIVRRADTPIEDVVVSLYAMRLFYGSIDSAWRDRVIKSHGVYETFDNAWADLIHDAAFCEKINYVDHRAATFQKANARAA